MDLDSRFTGSSTLSQARLKEIDFDEPCVGEALDDWSKSCQNFWMTRPLKDTLTWRYPPLAPYRTGRLKVSDLHEIYFEESGNPNGKPVVFVHGGPGAGSGPRQREFFDPTLYRIVLFDQRGSGRSTPHAELVDNTTWHLVSDMEALRAHLGISRWQVFGGSWGSALALAYAEKHPDKVSELVLRGIFLLRKWEIDWFYQDGAGAIYPDAWATYYSYIPENERGNMVEAYYRRLTSSDPKVRLEAARVWSVWEGSTSRLLPDSALIQSYGEDEFAIAFARVECHYFMNAGFFKDNQLLAEVNKIRHIPAVIVQGRYDIVCPMKSAWDLHQAWPEAEFILAPDAGHSAFEPSISKGLVAATDRFAVNK